jgi:putative flippase GtrA/glycosyltransferase involved in cell wall biosynthesis
LAESILARPSARSQVPAAIRKLNNPRFVGFAAVGLSVFLGGEVLLYGLVHMANLDAHIAYLIVAVVSIETNFVLNRFLNWRDRPGSLRRQYTMFHVTKIGTVILNQVLFAMLLSFDVHYLMAMFICTALITAINYTANDKLVFADVSVESALTVLPRDDELLAWSSAPKVGIVVPVRNSGRTIRGCLTSLLTQRYPDFQVYLVGSPREEDKTFEQIEDFLDHPRLTWIEWQRPPGWKGRDANDKRWLGAQTAVAEGATIIAFTDSHVAVPPRWIEKAVSLLRHKSVDAVAGVSRRHPTDRSLAGLYQDASWFSEWPRYGDQFLLNKENVGTAGQLPITANLIVRGDALKRSRPWHESPYGWDDFHLDWALLDSGSNVLCTNRSQVFRLHRPRFRLAKHVNAGIAAAEFYRKFPENGFVRRRLRRAALFVTAAVSVPTVLIGTLFLGSSVFTGTLCLLLLLTIGLLGMQTAQTARDWRAVVFPALDLLHIGLWIAGLTVAIAGTDRIKDRIFRISMTRRMMAEA